MKNKTFYAISYKTFHFNQNIADQYISDYTTCPRETERNYKTKRKKKTRNKETMTRRNEETITFA